MRFTRVIFISNVTYIHTIIIILKRVLHFTIKTIYSHTNEGKTQYNMHETQPYYYLTFILYNLRSYYNTIQSL